ncbi:PREDICTED: B3 domain-containing protein Os01g0234100 isoform X3 [Theobroma cacao]|uniref:B3 domain-containing protein Os01g0234100 isoform X3 n=1 Tax=Theobroma cacao TaxID=3641 RepID=A0AB32VR25_THECC|nr:PREDICTED: B3 domain-containing protein Os01g0234100 isoform X3 [Theobroma cacao]
MMMHMKMKVKVEEEEPTQMQQEPLVDEDEEDHLPISQLFQLLKQRQHQSLLSSSSSSMSMEIHDYPQKAARLVNSSVTFFIYSQYCTQICLSTVDLVHLYGCKRKRPRDKHSNDHVIKALPAVKGKAEEAWANSSANKRAEEVQANLPAEFPSFFKIMIPSMVCGCFWMALPKEFCQLHLPSHNTTVVLVDEGGKEYKTNFIVQRRALSGGWRKFSQEHGLLVGDALVFLLIRPSKFKVYILRVNGLGEVDAALGLLRLETRAKQTCIRKNNAEPFAQDINQYEVHRNSLSYPSAEENQSDNGSFDIGSSEVEGIRSSPEANAEFKQSRDAIGASKISPPQADFVAWDNTLAGFELLGMNVGVLRNRASRLLDLAFESKTQVKSRRFKEAEPERAYVEQEARSLKLQLLEKREEMGRLDADIEALKVNARRHKLMFEAVVNAPCMGI